jgi:SMP-30/Gluconolactonase/LRE-like region
MSEPKVLLRGLGIPESPRWHDGRLWFCNWIDQEVVAVAMDGTTQATPVPVERLMGWSIDWLPDGRMLTTGDKLRRYEEDGTTSIVADQGGNEIVVDANGRTYLNGADFNFSGGEAPKPGYIKLVGPDGAVREVASDIEFPKGMVITPDNRKEDCPTAGCSPKVSGRTASVSMPRARSGSRREASGSSASPRVAKYSNASRSARTGPRSRSRSVVPIGAPCSS